jgi:hypothetical protein
MRAGIGDGTEHSRRPTCTRHGLPPRRSIRHQEPRYQITKSCARLGESAPGSLHRTPVRVFRRRTVSCGWKEERFVRAIAMRWPISTFPCRSLFRRRWLATRSISLRTSKLRVSTFLSRPNTLLRPSHHRLMPTSGSSSSITQNLTRWNILLKHWKVHLATPYFRVSGEFENGSANELEFTFGCRRRADRFTILSLIHPQTSQQSSRCRSTIDRSTQNTQMNTFGLTSAGLAQTSTLTPVSQFSGNRAVLGRRRASAETVRKKRASICCSF